MMSRWLPKVAVWPVFVAIMLLVEPIQARSVTDLDGPNSLVDCTPGPVSAQLQPDILRALATDISHHWNLDGSDSDAMSSSVTVRVCFGAEGMPADFELLEASGPSQAGIDKLYASARRAVIRAYEDGGLPLPPDNYDAWRVLDLVFAANEMRAR